MKQPIATLIFHCYVLQCILEDWFPPNHQQQSSAISMFALIWICFHFQNLCRTSSPARAGSSPTATPGTSSQTPRSTSHLCICIFIFFYSLIETFHICNISKHIFHEKWSWFLCFYYPLKLLRYFVLCWGCSCLDSWLLDNGTKFNFTN